VLQDIPTTEEVPSLKGATVMTDGKNGEPNLQNGDATTAVEYHIVPNGDRWDVERSDSFTGSFAYDMDVAIGAAIADAQRDQHNGLKVSVCVQQHDGSCRHVWP
jgi:hypothetical protein